MLRLIVIPIATPMQRTFFLFVLLVLLAMYQAKAQSSIFAQSTIPDPVRTEKEFEDFYHFKSLAEKHFEEKDYEKAWYYLKTAEKDGIRDERFWFLLGKTAYFKDDKKAAKRYLTKGFRRFGCWDCGVAYEELFNEKFDFSKVSKNFIIP